MLSVGLLGPGFCLVYRYFVNISTWKELEQINKRVEVDDAEGIRNLGGCYSDGLYGLLQDNAKALELWNRSAKLGNTRSYYSIGNSYYAGNGVGRDEKKANHYWELAAIGGHVIARHNLGCFEEEVGNTDRALKHYMIAAGCGHNNSLENIKQMYKYKDGEVTKDDYTNALRSYQAYLVDIKSSQRDQAAAINDQCKYC